MDIAYSEEAQKEYQRWLKTKQSLEYQFKEDIKKFDRDFVYSPLSKSIDSVDTSIIGNITSIKVQKRISPVINAPNSYTGPSVIKFVNSLFTD